MTGPDPEDAVADAFEQQRGRLVAVVTEDNDRAPEDEALLADSIGFALLVVLDTLRPADERQQQRAVVDAFLAAARVGDFEGLLRVLDPEVTWRAHTARGVIVRVGASEVAGKAQHGVHAKLTAHRVLVNGEPGIVAWDAKGKPRSVMACKVTDGRIVEILSVSDPERLDAMDLPGRNAQA
jgi:ketosteroid isomerase-like protein